MIPDNPYLDRAETLPDAADAQVLATLALVYEQHQRNRLAAITAHTKGITLPTDLAALAEEDPS